MIITHLPQKKKKETRKSDILSPFMGSFRSLIRRAKRFSKNCVSKSNLRRLTKALLNDIKRFPLRVIKPNAVSVHHSNS